jgi:hypothetical protein
LMTNSLQKRYREGILKSKSWQLVVKGWPFVSTLGLG